LEKFQFSSWQSSWDRGSNPLQGVGDDLEAEIDIMSHELVPKHILLSAQEKEEVMRKYGIKKLSQFPRILKSDPVVKKLKATPGDMIKIIRKSDTAKESIYYRVVSED